MPGPSSGPANWFYAILKALGLVAVGAGGLYAFGSSTGVLLQNGTGASTPASGFVSVYSKTADKGVYAKDATGAETLLGSAGSPTITGTGTANKVSKFTAAGVIGNSSLTDTGSLVTVANPLTVNGTQILSDAAGTGHGLIKAVSGKQVRLSDNPNTDETISHVVIAGQAGGNTGWRTLTLQGIPSQTGRLLELQNSAGTEVGYGSINGTFACTAGFLTITADTAMLTTGLELKSSNIIGFSSTSAYSGTKDATIYRTGVNELALGTTGATGAGTTKLNTGNTVGLTADYTNATASYTSSNFSRTLVAGQRYAIDAVISCNQSVAIDGAYFSFGGSATATSYRGTAIAIDSAGVTTVSTATALTTDLGATTFTGRGVIRISGTVVCNAGGTFILQGRMESVTTGLLTMDKETYLSVTPVTGL